MPMNLDMYWRRRDDRSTNLHRCPVDRQLVAKVRTGLSKERWQARACGLLFLLLIVGLQGCQTTWFFERSTGVIDNVSFKNLWKTYTHCRSSSDPDEMRVDAQQLDQAAHAVRVKSQSPIVLPAPMQHLISEPPSRLAVDPKAMAMDCALYAGQVARSAGQPRLAVEMSKAVMGKQSEAIYGYYVSEAARELEQMGHDTHVVMETNDSASGSF